MMSSLPRLVRAAVLLALPAALAAQAAPDSVMVTWAPIQPRQGSLIEIVLRVGSPLAPRRAELRGQLAGQPLHFERDATGRFRALAGVPISATGTMPLTVSVARPDGEPRDWLVRIPVLEGAFGVERLRVDSRYVTPPDSALQARIAAENRAARRVAERSHDTPRLWSGTFRRPATGRVTSPYGKGREFNGVVESRHMGTDFSGLRGDPVVAVNRGVVALVGDFYYAGRVVYVDHGRGLVTAYLHLSEVAVAQGDTVKAGQLIGRMGATGRVTGPHLHLIARYGTITVDAMTLIGRDLSGFGTPER